MVAGCTRNVDTDGRVRPPAQTGHSGKRCREILRSTANIPPEEPSRGGPMKTWNAV